MSSEALHWHSWCGIDLLSIVTTCPGVGNGGHFPEQCLRSWCLALGWTGAKLRSSWHWWLGPFLCTPQQKHPLPSCPLRTEHGPMFCPHNGTRDSPIQDNFARASRALMLKIPRSIRSVTLIPCRRLSLSFFSTALRKMTNDGANAQPCLTPAQNVAKSLPSNETVVFM